MCKKDENFDIWKQNKKEIILGNHNMKFLMVLDLDFIGKWGTQVLADVPMDV